MSESRTSAQPTLAEVAEQNRLAQLELELAEMKTNFAAVKASLTTSQALSQALIAALAVAATPAALVAALVAAPAAVVVPADLVVDAPVADPPVPVVAAPTIPAQAPTVAPAAATLVAPAPSPAVVPTVPVTAAPVAAAPTISAQPPTVAPAPSAAVLPTAPIATATPTTLVLAAPAATAPTIPEYRRPNVIATAPVPAVRESLVPAPPTPNEELIHLHMIGPRHALLLRLELLCQQHGFSLASRKNKRGDLYCLDGHCAIGLKDGPCKLEFKAEGEDELKCKVKEFNFTCNCVRTPNIQLKPKKICLACATSRDWKTIHSCDHCKRLNCQSESPPGLAFDNNQICRKCHSNDVHNRQGEKNRKHDTSALLAIFGPGVPPACKPIVRPESIQESRLRADALMLYIKLFKQLERSVQAQEKKKPTGKRKAPGATRGSTRKDRKGNTYYGGDSVLSLEKFTPTPDVHIYDKIQFLVEWLTKSPTTLYKELGDGCRGIALKPAGSNPESAFAYEALPLLHHIRDATIAIIKHNTAFAGMARGAMNLKPKPLRDSKQSIQEDPTTASLIKGLDVDEDELYEGTMAAAVIHRQSEDQIGKITVYRPHNDTVDGPTLFYPLQGESFNFIAVQWDGTGTQPDTPFLDKKSQGYKAYQKWKASIKDKEEAKKVQNAEDLFFDYVANHAKTKGMYRILIYKLGVGQSLVFAARQYAHYTIIPAQDVQRILLIMHQMSS